MYGTGTVQISFRIDFIIQDFQISFPLIYYVRKSEQSTYGTYTSVGSMSLVA